MAVGDITMGSGTMGMGTMGREELELAPTPVDTSRPLFRVRIWWDGDASAETTYTDQPYSELLGEEARVITWGTVTRQAKGVASFDRWSFSLSNVPDAAGNSVADEWSASNPPEGKHVELEYRLEDVVPAWAPGLWLNIFRGAIIEVPQRSATVVEFVASNELELLNRDVLTPILAATWPTAPDASLDKHVPLVLGEVETVEGVLVKDAPIVSLGLPISSTTLLVEITQGQVPVFTAPGEARIDAEEISFSSLVENVLPGGSIWVFGGVVRGINGTAGASHLAGADIVPTVPASPVAWAFNTAASASITNVQLVDSAGDVRQVPDDVTTTTTLAAPSTIELDAQPVISAPEVAGPNSFLFIDTDTGDTSAPNTSTGYPLATLQKVCGRTEEYTETNFLTLDATDPALNRATVYRAAAVDCFPAQASILSAWAVVEHFEDGGSTDVDTELNGSILATDTGDILVDSITGFHNAISGPQHAYIGEELITYTSVTSSPSARLQGVTRGHNTYGAAAWPDNTAVRQSAVECSVRIDDGGANVVATIDGEGFTRAKPTTPQQVAECSGLQVASKGFEDAHTHVVPGEHTHLTDTEHTHEAALLVEWSPSFVQGIKPIPPGSQCVPPQTPDWSAPYDLTGSYGDAVDSNSSTSTPFQYQAPNNFAHWRIRSTSGDLSPTDTRKVTKIEATLGTSWTFSTVTGLVTVKWQAGLGFCQLIQDVNTGSVGGPTLNVSTGAVGVIAGGNTLQFYMDLPRSPATYNANQNTIYVDSFTTDVSALNLTVGDFVDRDYGGTTDKAVWIHWQANNLDVHQIDFRLFVDETTGVATIPDPVDNTPWEDTNSTAPLSISSLSWFDLSPKVTSITDLLNTRLQVRHIAGSPYLNDVHILRCLFVLEISTTNVAGDETPKRLVASVDSTVGALSGGLKVNKASTYVADLFRNAALLNDATLLTLADFTAIQDQVVEGVGVVTRQTTYAALIQELADGARLVPVWRTSGNLGMSYRRAATALAGDPHGATFRRGDMLPSDGGPRVTRAPLRDLITDVTVKAAPDPLKGGYSITSQVTNATAETAFGTSAKLEVIAPYVSDQVGANNLSAHVLDYNSTLPERVTWRAYLSTKALGVDVGDIVSVVTPEVERFTLVIERIVVHLGTYTGSQPPFVEIVAVVR